MSQADMAADKTPGPTPRGKIKKKSTLAKLVERKKRQISDADSEYGSRVSLNDKNESLQQNSLEQSSVPLEPDVVVARMSPTSILPQPQLQIDGDEKPKPRPRRNSKVSQEPVSVESSVSQLNDKWEQPADLEDAAGKLPSEATVYRFRNMRMAADQTDTTDGLKKGPFVPKPPSTPRTPRNTAVVKGEKRNHEANSSGDETDMKRQVPGSSGPPETRRQLTSHADGESPTDMHKSHAKTGFVLPVQSPTRSASKDSPAKLLGSLAGSAGGSEMSEETIDQLHQHYDQIMAASKDSPQSARPTAVYAGPSDTSPRKLNPIPVKNAPPPMDMDMTSHAMRTAYKADPTYRWGSSNMLKKMSKYHSEDGLGNGGESSGHLESDNMSFTSTSVMPVITTQEARSRSFLVGSVSSGASSIMGAEELERYFPDRKIHVFSGSWNMNELKELQVDLNDFILPEACEYVQDVYAVGTQENEMNKREWEIRLQETLGPSHVLFHSVSYGSLNLAIFIRRDLIWFCSEPEEDMVSLRAITMVKTKGAIGICFFIFGTSFLFINCHLTSDRGSSKNAHRLLDYHRVTQELKLPHHRVSKQAYPSSNLSDVTARFDCVFWCGDLNFRLERRRVAVEGMVTQMTTDNCIPHFEELLGGDQLSKLITEGKIFGGFQEGRINFQPTFKFDVSTDNYDTSAKNRIPSYTDRILFRSRKKNQISCLHYDAVMNIKVSDHRAVYAFFEATLRPGRDNIMLCAGQFDREVYLEANRRRAQSQLVRGDKNSRVCALQ